MGPIPFALSIHHFINSVGADAGFASIIGLAILILLYFAQARETSSLRKHAYEATERIQQLEARVAQMSRAQTAAAQPQQARPAAVAGSRPAVAVGAAAGAAAVGAAAAGAATGAPAAAPVAARAMAPAAPAGVAAPALTAATRLIPAPAAFEPAAAPVGGGGTASAIADPPATALAAAPAADAPPPATVAGGANGSGDGMPPRPAVTTAPGMARPLMSGTSAGWRPGVAPGGRAAPAKSRLPRVLMVLLGLLGVAAVVAAVLIVTGGSSSSSSSATTGTSSAASARRSSRAVVVNPASVTVAVLNGTAINGLAHRVASRLQSSGYKQGADQNAPDQTHTATIVAYLPGFKRDAEAVATTLKLHSGAVQQVDQSTQAVACPGPGACNANVVVTVGTDLANNQ
jgi:LytR cell envelope-related transcriptional attenuator